MEDEQKDIIFMHNAFRNICRYIKQIYWLDAIKNKLLD